MKALNLIMFVILLNLVGSGCTRTPTKDYPVQPVSFTSVEVLPGFWYDRIETNREVTIPYNFKKCEETGRISNFAKAGGLEEGKFEGIRYNDSDLFKVIEGASYSLQVHPDPQLSEYLDEVISKIAAAQEDDGYLYTIRTIDPKKLQERCGEERWSYLDHSHELYNVGHMYEAAVAHFQATGKRTFLDVAIKNADLICEVFGPGKHMGVPGHQEIEIGLVKLYRVTGDEKYLNLAQFFIDQRGNAEGHKLYGSYCQDHKPFIEQEEAVGHSVRAMYLYTGAADVAALTDNQAYIGVLEKIWQEMVYTKTYLTGGIGAEPKHEGFGPAYELPNATAYTETCAAIGVMLWNYRMFLLSGEVKYMDLFERTLYNGFLAGISLTGDEFFYPNPLESDGIMKFNQGACTRSPWFSCSCCPVNIVRMMPSLPGYVYTQNQNEVYINLFVNSATGLKVNDQSFSIKQQSEYPWDGKIMIDIDTKNMVSAKLKIRIPAWNRNQVLPGDLYSYLSERDEIISLSVNGDIQQADIENGYLILDREWEGNTSIILDMDMPVRLVKSHEKVEANKNKIAIERGPLVYCAEQIDNSEGVLDIIMDPNQNFQYEYDNEVLNGLGVLKGSVIRDNSSQTFDFKAIPYYAWSHRGVGEMAVWFSLAE